MDQAGQCPLSVPPDLKGEKLHSFVLVFSVAVRFLSCDFMSQSHNASKIFYLARHGHVLENVFPPYKQEKNDFGTKANH